MIQATTLLANEQRTPRRCNHQYRQCRHSNALRTATTTATTEQYCGLMKKQNYKFQCIGAASTTTTITTIPTTQTGDQERCCI